MVGGDSSKIEKEGMTYYNILVDIEIATDLRHK
jgi:hypothetical protein